MGFAGVAPAAFADAAPRALVVETTERIAPLRSSRTGYVVAAAAALAVLVTMALAINLRREARSAAPRPAAMQGSDARSAAGR